MSRGRVGWRLAVRFALVAALAATVALSVDRAGLPRAAPEPVPGPLAAETGPVRQTEVEAVAAAKATGEPVEVGAYRGERREVWANPDGSFTEVRHQQPVRTVRNGRWVPTDATLIRRPDGTVGPRAAVIGLRLSGGGDGPFATVTRAGRSLGLSWPGRLPEPVLADNTATYREIVPGVDLVVHVGLEGFSQTVVVKTRQAALRPEITALALGVRTTGLRLTEAGDGRLAAVDVATGGTVFEAPAAAMWDSGDPAEPAGRTAVASGAPATLVAPATAKRARLGVRVAGGTLHLTPDAAMLSDPATRFPVYLDPFVQGTSNSAWAMVDSGYPNEEYWKFDGARDERIGYCPGPAPISGCNNSLVKRLLYAIPTPYQDDRITILDAKFKVTMVHTYDGTARNASLYRMGAGISSATNWNNQPGWSRRLDTRAPTGTQGSCTATNQNVEFTATVGVQEAAANNWGTTTFGIRADNESDNRHIKRFCDNAVLSVTYNRAPNQPPTSALSMNPGGSCVSGSGRPYVSSLPVLSATLSDPDTGDAEPLSAQFRVTWTPPGGSLQTVTWTSSTKNNGSLFTYNTADPATGTPTLSENVVASWEVRASDGTAWGPWSSDGTPTACEFILDKTKPSGPDVDSPEYLPLDAPETTPACVEDQTWYDGVGRYGTFTFDSAATDVYKYEYGFDTTPQPANVLLPSTDGGPVTVSWLAESEGPHTVQVRAVDRAGKTSDVTACTFRVAAGAPPAAAWGLSDEPGPVADDSVGGNDAQAFGVTFAEPGPGGAADRSVMLAGTSGSYLATTGAGLVNTAKGFAVSAWVKLADDTADRIAVSQDGSGEPGFMLGFNGSNKQWMFRVPVTDVDTLGYWTVYGPVAVVNEWTHLVGAYDPVRGKLTLHVNAGTPTEVDRRSTWRSRGAIQIGRRYAKTGYTSHWKGNIAEVAVFNRIVTAAEVEQLATLAPTRQGYWELDAATIPDDNPAVQVSPESTGDEAKELTLNSGAYVFTYDPDQFPPPTETALVGGGHLVLDGADDYAATAAPLARTDGSFSVTARVRLASACDRDMVVLSQPGTNTSAFTLRCHKEGTMSRWELAMPETDGTGTPPQALVFDDQRLPNTDQSGQHLAVTYNEFLNEVRLYVDGQLAVAGRATHTSVWQAGAGGLQVGRARRNGAFGDYFAGVVDEVRVYAGVLDQTTVQRIASLTEQPDL